MKAWRRFRYMPFGYKLMLSYCLFIVLPVVVIGYFANSVYIKSIREQIESSVNGTLVQVSDNVSYKIDDMIRISDFLYVRPAWALSLGFKSRMVKAVVAIA